MHLDQLERAVAGRDPGVAEHGAGRRVDARRQRPHPPDLQPAAVVGGPRARARVPGAHDAGEVVGGQLPVERELLDRELVGVGGLAVLRNRRGGGHRGKRRDQQLGAGGDEPGAQLAGGLVRADRADATAAYTGPVSSPASSAMMHTPVSVSPASIARSTGAAPRQRGSNEKCTFTNPCGTASSSAGGSS